MPSPAPKKQETTVTKPRHKMQGHTYTVVGILHLHNTRRIITCSWDGSLRVWDIASGKQVGEPWTDEGSGEVYAIALSPNGEIVASGSQDGAVRLWDINTPGKVMAKWTGHTESVLSVSWSPDGARVVSGSGEKEGEFIIWDVESGETILKPTKSGDVVVRTVCYSPDSTMIAMGGGRVKVWDANTGELLKTLEFGLVRCMTWTLDGKTLIAGAFRKIKKFDTATWIEIGVLDGHEHTVYGITLSPNERILASASDDTTTRLWNLENDQPIVPPLQLEEPVTCATFSADGRFLATGCDDDHVYTWDVSAILKNAGLENLLIDNNTVKKPSNVDADITRRRAPKIEGARRIPPGFFDDSSTSRGHHTASLRQTTGLGRLQSHNPLNWAQNFVSGILRGRHGSDRLHVPPIVEVPLTAGKPRNYHARKKKPSASSSRPPNPHTSTQQQSGRATQNNLSSSQQPLAAASASTTPPIVTGTTGAASTVSPPDITIRRAGWRARFLLWVCCVPIQNTAGQH